MSKHTLPAAERVRVEVDGVAVEVPANYNLIQACKAAGVFLPHYCWHPSLSVPANCRLCLVKCENAPGIGRPGQLVAGCHAQVMDGMRILVDDPDARDSREGMMEFLLANHPLDCPQCDRGGECELQRFSMDYGAGETRFSPNAKRRFPKPQMDPLIDIERNRCILCTRCTRFCAEVAGDPVMGVFGRGDQCYIGTFGDGPVSNIYSGNTIDICPVGCLTNKPYRFQARPWELRQVSSTCVGCSAGCAVTYWMRGGEVYRTTPPSQVSEQFNKFALDSETVDFICNQGRFGSDFGRSADRALVPVVRAKGWKGSADDAKKPLPSEGAEGSATMEKALERTAKRLKKAAENGKAAILVSPRATNEEFLAAQHLAKVALGTSNIDWRTRLPHREAADALSEAQAIANGSLDRVHEYDAVLLLGSSAQQVAPLAGLEIKEAARRGQTKLFVAAARVDPFFSDVATGAFTVEPGREGELMEWLAGGAEGDKPDYASPCGGTADPKPFSAMIDVISGGSRILLAYDPCAFSGLAAGSMVKGVKAMAKTFGERLHTLPVLKDRNAAGAFLAGAQPDRVPMGPASDEAALKRWSAKVGAGADKLAPADGLSGPEILEKAAAGEIEALLVIGGGDALDPHPFPALVDKALENTPFVAVTELLDGPIARRARVVLPAANFYEKTGSMLNLEGRVARLAQAEDPLGASLSDFDILRALCELLESPFPFETPGSAYLAWQAAAHKAGAFSEHEAPSRADGAVVEAAVNFARRGAPKKSMRAFLRRAEALNGFEPAKDAPRPAEGEGLALAWDDHVQGFDHSFSRSSQADILAAPPTVEIHPEDAEKLGLHARDQAEVALGSGSEPISAKVVVSKGVRPGTAYVGRNVAGLALDAGAGSLPRAALKKAEAKTEA